MPAAKKPEKKTRYHLEAEKLIAAPRSTSFEEYRDAIKRIRKIYYKPLGNVRRRAVRKRLDEHLAGLTALALSDPKIAVRSRGTLPPSYLKKK